MAELPRILFGHERGNLRSTRLALIEWLKRGQRKKIVDRYLGVGLVCAVSVEVVLSFRCNRRVKETV